MPRLNTPTIPNVIGLRLTTLQGPLAAYRIVCRGLAVHTPATPFGHDHLMPAEQDALALARGWRRVVSRHRVEVMWFCPTCVARLGIEPVDPPISWGGAETWAELRRRLMLKEGSPDVTC